MPNKGAGPAPVAVFHSTSTGVRGLLKISVVTACYNAAEFIEDTLRSVLDQRYPNLEYIVLDGGSTDGTQQIIERYADRLAHYSSGPDGGQYEAIKRGLDLATGDILCWINADDVLMPWSFSTVNAVFEAHPDTAWITGLPSFYNRVGQMTGVYGAVAAYPREYIAQGWFNRELGGFLQQESMFWRRSLWERSGGLDLSFTHAADYELWTRFAQHAALEPVAVPLASFRKLPGQQRSSVGADKYDAEVAAVMARHAAPPRPWSAVASKGVVARNLARLVIRKTAPAIVYHEPSQSWRRVVTRRPLSRATLRDMLLLRALDG